jgi:hypothetical protein
MAARREVVPVPSDPYERLQAARAAVQARNDERAALAASLLELASGGDEESLAEASARLDALPGELHAAELDLAMADVAAARATLRAAEASLARARDELDEAGAPSKARARLETDEDWVRECRSAAERAERRFQALTARPPGGPGAAAGAPGAAEPADAGHRVFAKRVTEARAGIERAGAARSQAELDLLQATELAKVALERLADAAAGSDWRAIQHAREARADAAGAVGPAWEALRCASLRVARAEYELRRLVEERLA